jgi:hypothetical protein
MPVTLVACPSCGKTLRLSAPVPAGKRLGCPSCGAAFAPAPPAPTPARFTPASPPPRNGSPPTLAHSAPPGPPRSGRGPLLLGLVFGGLLILGGGAVLLAFALGKKPEEKRQVAVDPPKDKEKSAEKKPDDPPRASDTDGAKERGTKESPPAADRPDEPKRRDPPGRDPRSDDPPKQDPPKQDPPKQDPPKQDPPKGEPARLSADQQEKVNRALDNGLAYLRKSQLDDGTWGFWEQNKGFRVGFASLPALTLLECGVPPDDPQVKKAAAFVRSHMADLNTTYDLALAVLFLDRLGDPADEPVIRTAALRLIAGQSPAGGWSYTCPLLDGGAERSVLVGLQLNRPRDLNDLMLPGPDGKDLAGDRPFPDRPGERLPARDPEAAARLAAGLPAPACNAPALLRPADTKKNFPVYDGGDNSNTQFAALAVLAAGRHGVPNERALALLARRFRTGQAQDGTWGYYHQKGGGQGMTPAMIGSGLLGLAAGHGLLADDKERKNVEDPQVDRALAALGSHVGGNDANLYFLWTLERVAVLYNLQTVGGKDWYVWGVESILKTQQGDGSWNVGGYHGAQRVPDTCFALLFLKRANLAKELTKKLEFVIEAKDPGKK